MANVSEFSIVTYLCKPGHWRGAVIPDVRIGSVGGERVRSVVTLMADGSETIAPARHRDRWPAVRRRPSGDLSCTLGQWARQHDNPPDDRTRPRGRRLPALRRLDVIASRSAPHRSTVQHDLADKSFPGKSISYAHRCQRSVSAADIALAKKPRITASMQAVRYEQTISAAAFMGSEIQLGDGPMNLPVELQRRLDGRWSARFGMPEQGSARSAVAHPRSNLCPDLPTAVAYALMGDGTSRADHPDRAKPAEDHGAVEVG